WVFIPWKPSTILPSESSSATSLIKHLTLARSDLISHELVLRPRSFSKTLLGSFFVAWQVSPNSLPYIRGKQRLRLWIFWNKKTGRPLSSTGSAAHNQISDGSSLMDISVL